MARQAKKQGVKTRRFLPFVAPAAPKLIEMIGLHYLAFITLCAAKSTSVFCG